MMGWLHAIPKPDARSRRAKLQTEQPRVSRLEQMKALKITPAMPPNPCPIIIDRLVEIGLTDRSGFEPDTLKWTEIDAWCHRTGVDLPPWEGRLIRKLSEAYLAAKRSGESETCPPPWRGEVTKSEINAEQAMLDDILG